MLPFPSLLLLLGCTATVAAVPVQPYDATHARWDRVLHQYVHDGVVDYSGIRGAGRTEFEAYLGEVLQHLRLVREGLRGDRRGAHVPEALRAARDGPRGGGGLARRVPYDWGLNGR